MSCDLVFLGCKVGLVNWRGRKDFTSESGDSYRHMDLEKHLLKNHLQELELDYFAVIREIPELCFLEKNKLYLVCTLSYYILLSTSK